MPRTLINRFQSAGLFAQFLLVGLSVGVITAAAIAWYVDARITDLVLDQVVRRAVDQVEIGVLTRVEPADFQGPYTPERLDSIAARLDPPLRAILDDKGVIRLHLFNLEGTVIYSDLAAKRGQRLPEGSNDSLSQALRGTTVTKSSSLSSEENADLRSRYGSALEVYVPVTLDGRTVGAYEVYQDPEPLRPVRPLIWGSLGFGAVVILIALAFLVRGAEALIAHQQEEYRRLAHKTADREASLEMDVFRRELLGTVSHELRTPLSLVHGYAELLAESGATFDPESMREMAQEIHRGSSTMRRMVEDLLDLSRMQRGRLDMAIEETRLNNLILNLLPHLRELPGGERIHLDLDAVPATRVDPKQFEHITTNLVMNALSYATEGPVLIRLKHPAPGWTVLEIIDHGPGLAPEVLPRVWESFYRAPETMTTQTRGAGVGLSVVKTLAEGHGGYVEAESDFGHGATFRVYLPCIEEPAHS